MEGSISDEDVSQHQQIAQTFTPTAKYKLQSLFFMGIICIYCFSTDYSDHLSGPFHNIQIHEAHYPNPKEKHTVVINKTSMIHFFRS